MKSLFSLSIKFGVEAIQIHKLIMSALFGDYATLENENHVWISDCRQPMCNNDTCAAVLGFVQGVLYNLFIKN